MKQLCLVLFLAVTLMQLASIRYDKLGVFPGALVVLGLSCLLRLQMVLPQSPKGVGGLAFPLVRLVVLHSALIFLLVLRSPLVPVAVGFPPAQFCWRLVKYWSLVQRKAHCLQMWGPCVQRRLESAVVGFVSQLFLGWRSLGPGWYFPFWCRIAFVERHWHVGCRFVCVCEMVPCVVLVVHFLV